MMYKIFIAVIVSVITLPSLLAVALMFSFPVPTILQQSSGAILTAWIIGFPVLLGILYSVMLEEEIV